MADVRAGCRRTSGRHLPARSGACAASGATGSYFRMILANGSPTGPYLNNSDSPCSDQSYTPLQPGTDGGLRTGGYQPVPSPAFDKDGNALAKRITLPAKFYGTGFATATNAVDPQTSARTTPPTVTADGSRLTADLRSFAAVWNNQYFNQGSPKPDGSLPGNTRPATGTYDASTGAFTLEWTSQIVGGPFDKFTGQWHLQGTFVPAASGAAARPAAPGAGTTAVTAAPQSGSTTQAVPRSGAAGAPVLPGAGTGPAASAAPTAAGAAHAPTVLASSEPVASVRTTRSTSWSVQWWVVALAVALALLGFGALHRLQRSIAAAGEAP